MTSSAIREKPKLLYAAQVKRGRYFRRFLRALLLVVLAGAAYWALVVASARGLADLRLLDAGQLVAVVLMFLLSVRGLYNLVRALTTRTESVQFYDQGLVWSRRGESVKYAWQDLRAFRDSTGGLYLRRWPVFQTGALTLRMHDGSLYTFNGRFGDTRPCAKAIRRYAAYVTGIQMGRKLRSGKKTELGRQLSIEPSGVDTGKGVVPWEALDIRRDGTRLIVRQKADGKWRTVRRYDTRRLDNVGGFLELAAETIQIHQPGRRKASTSQDTAEFVDLFRENLTR